LGHGDRRKVLAEDGRTALKQAIKLRSDAIGPL